MIRKVICSTVMLFSCLLTQGQVNWLSFEQLDSALNANPKPIFIEFYTDWCTYCKKMEQEVFTYHEVINELNSSFYAVRFDAENEDSITFEDIQYVKDQNASFHPLAMALASQNDQFTPPALIFLDEDFKVKSRVFSYQSKKNLLTKLRKHH